MKRFALIITILAFLSEPIRLLSASNPPAAPYESARTAAEKFYAEGSYRRAHELYQQMELDSLSAEERRWVEFRRADTAWRAEGEDNEIEGKADEARQKLQELIAAWEKAGIRDALWAEAHESSGDFWWMRRRSGNWSAAWPHYSAALDFWAGNDQIDLARTRYLRIVWRMATPPWGDDGYGYGYYAQSIPGEILENARTIAQTPNDKSRAAFLLAQHLKNRGDLVARDRIAGLFEEALSAGRTSEWYDDALYHYAQWLEQAGRIVYLENGSWRVEPDFPKALTLYRRLLSEFKKGETRFYDDAQSRIRDITSPALFVSVPNIFLPGSEVEAAVSWRNISKINFELVEVDLTRDLQFGQQNEVASWLQRIDISRGRRISTFTREADTKGDYVPGSTIVRLEKPPAPGAYVLVATSGSATARELILVTDIALLVRATPTKGVVFAADAITGAPVAGARVKLFEQFYDNGPRVVEAEATTDEEGLARFNLSQRQSYNIFVTARKADKQAFGGTYRSPRAEARGTWRIFAFTDRPAYRPGETVQWKATARVYDGSSYTNPSGQTIAYEIFDSRGNKVSEGKAALNSFGSMWASFPLTDQMPLGEYRINFKSADSSHIGSAVLFRLEEYKLPEFRVSVVTPEEKGRKKTFRIGERVEATVRAEYYFGGAVTNADVELVVKQRPFYRYWTPTRPYPWYFNDAQRQSSWYGGEQIIKREKTRTDANGEATVVFDTPQGSGDLEFIIEARVIDASRREIVGSGTVRVTSQSYFVQLQPQHYIHKPGTPVTIDIHGLDANDEPVAVTGKVLVTREWWYEVWLSPEGKKIAGEELEKVRRQFPSFPPQAEPDKHPWKLISRGYEKEDVLTQSVTTDAEGKAALEFTPSREGFYRVAWTSEDRWRDQPLRPSDVVRAETTVWVATNQTTTLGYYQGGLQIIVDRETFRSGQTAPVMIVAPTNGRHVLFSVEADDIYDMRLLHLQGNTRVIELPITDKHVPNIFLSAYSVFDRQLLGDTKEVVVPPVKQFIDVEVKTDRKEYEPREKGTLTITTRDHTGKAVPAEVALSLVDESVFAIQSDYAIDPRQFFYGDKRGNRVSTSSSFNQRQYVKLVEGSDRRLVDVRFAERKRQEKDEALISGAAGRKNLFLEDAVQENIAVTGQASAEYGRFDMAAKSAVAPAPAAPPAAEPAPPPPPPGEAVVVRSDFRSTIFWQPDISTAANGQTTIDFTYPDSLTTWKATARAATTGNEFGAGSSTSVTRKPLLVRLQAPRFFVVGDEVTISAVINNNTGKPVQVTPSLGAEGLEVISGNSSAVDVPAQGDRRVDWRVAVRKEGTALLRVTARGASTSDAMERSYPIYEHGIEKLVAKSGKTRSADTTIRLELPRERKAGSTTLHVQVTPSIAVTMLDALPYLIDYPYGCTEQTMSRFLPAAIVAKTLNDLGVDRTEFAGRLFGGIEPATAAATHRDGKRDLAKLDDLIAKGLARLYDFQHSDGGWGWWKEGESDHYMSGYVVWGLALARSGGVPVREGVIDRGVEFLRREIVERERDWDTQAWMLHAIAAARRGSISDAESKAVENLWTNRDRLRPYAKAAFAIAVHSYGMKDRAAILARNLENGAKIDQRPDESIVIGGGAAADESLMATAYWGEDGFWWRWVDSPVESTALILRALVTIDPNHRLVEPSMNWLVKNRRGAQWSNTRDTALAILGLNEYLKKSGETSASAEYEVSVNGKQVAREKVTSIIRAPSRFDVPAAAIVDGVNQIRIRRLSGNSPLYFSAEAEFFSLEEPVKPAGNEIFVEREYYRLVGKPTLLKGYVYDKVKLRDGETVQSGDRIEVVVRVETKNDYEYLVFEDLKPGGFEAVAIRSGGPVYAMQISTKLAKAARSTERVDRIAAPTYPSGQTRWVHQELRDRKVAMFADKLPQGIWEIRYDLRAEVPGSFHALPLMGHAMYAPEIRANGTEMRVKVVD